MIWFCLISTIYLAGFVWLFRNRLRAYLNNLDKISTARRDNEWGPLERTAGATMMALFWPITMIIPMLASTVKTDKKIQQDQEDAKLRLHLERTALREKAQALNIPGWEQL